MTAGVYLFICEQNNSKIYEWIYFQQMLIRERGTGDSIFGDVPDPQGTLSLDLLQGTFLDNPGHRVKNKNYKTQKMNIQTYICCYGIWNYFSIVFEM